MAADNAVEEPARSKRRWRGSGSGSEAGIGVYGRSSTAPASPDTRALLQQLEDGNDLEEEEDDDDDDQLGVAPPGGGGRSCGPRFDHQPEMISESGVEIEEIDPELLVGPFSLDGTAARRASAFSRGLAAGPVAPRAAPSAGGPRSPTVSSRRSSTTRSASL